MNFINVKSYLWKYGSQVVAEMRTRLKNQGKIATGKLYDSLGFKILQNADKIELSFTSVNYMKYVDKGRRPGKFPPIKKIRQWCIVKGIPTSAAYPIARKISQVGIRPTNFFSISTKRRMSQFTKNFEAAYKMDVESAMSEVIREINTK